MKSKIKISVTLISLSLVIHFLLVWCDTNRKIPPQPFLLFRSIPIHIGMPKADLLKRGILLTDGSGGYTISTATELKSDFKSIRVKFKRFFYIERISRLDWYVYSDDYKDQMGFNSEIAFTGLKIESLLVDSILTEKQISNGFYSLRFSKYTGLSLSLEKEHLE